MGKPRDVTMQSLVRDVRIRKNITQEELAEAVGVTRQTIIAIEKGNYTPSVALALALSHFFNKKVEDLFLYEH